MWIAVSNLYTFVYTEWGVIYVHATYCHTLGKEEVLLTSTDVGSLRPPWIHFREKMRGGDPRSAPEEQETPVYTRGEWGGHHLTDTVQVDMSADWCVKQLCAWTPGAWRIDFARAVSGSNGDGGKQQRVWVLQVLLSVSAQFHRLHDSNNRTTQLEAESDFVVQTIWSRCRQHTTLLLNTVLSYSYLKSQDWLRSHYRLMWCIKVCPMQDLNQLDIFLFFFPAAAISHTNCVYYIKHAWRDDKKRHE